MKIHNVQSRTLRMIDTDDDKARPTLTSLIADAVGIGDSVGKNHCISIADTLSSKFYDEILLHKQ